MKNIFLLIFFLAAINLSAQCGMSVNATVTGSYCFGTCTGSAIIAVSGGLAPYSFSWNGVSSSNDTVTGLCAGTYTCYVTDQTPCTDSVVVTITQPTQINITFGLVPGCAGLCNGQICANVFGGTPPYSYAWTNGVTTSCANGLCSGTYTVTVTDANGCSANAVATINNNLPAPVIDSIVSSLGDTLTTCDTCTTLTAYVSSGSGPFNFLWSGACGTTQFNNFQLCNLSGACTQTVVVSDNFGCAATGTITIVGPPPVTFVTAVVVNDSCNMCVGSINNVNASGGLPPYQYSWTGPGNFSSAQQNISNLCGGTYTLTVADSNQCTKTQTFSPGNALNAYLSVSGTVPNCPNTCTGTATANYTGPNAPYTYQWNTVPPQSSATAINLCPGTYTCTVTDSAGCMASVAKTVLSVYSTPIITPYSVINPTCGLCNGSFYIPFTNGYTTNVTGPGGYNAVGTNFTNMCAGVYTITATRPGCTTFTNTVALQLQSGSIPGITVTPSITAESCNGMLDGAISLAVSGTPSPLTYLWNTSQNTPGISNLMGGAYTVTINDTNGNCHKQTFNVPQAGTNCAYINGKVFADLNTDCSYNLADYGIAGTVVWASPGNYYAYTNAAGDYTIILPPGAYTVQHFTYQQGYIPHCNTSPVVTLTTGSNTAVADFPDSLNPMPDLKIGYFSSTQAVPGFTQTLTFSVENSSVFYSTALNGTVKLVLQPDQYFNSATPAPALISGDTLTWYVSGMNAFTSQAFSVNVTVAANPSLIGSVFFNCASVVCTNQTDLQPFNNTKCNTLMVVGAFDPNDKAVSPIGENSTGDIPLSDSVFTYTVRFQNTGNAPAHDVIILDSISPKLDLTTFEFLGSSHSCSVDFLAGDVARFSFINIMLPDSNADEPGSHGWLQYSIRKKASAGIGDVVENTAHIYFDFNPAIVTNTTINTYTLPTPVAESDLASSDVFLFPNPAQNMLYIREANNQAISLVEISDLSGKKVAVRQFSQHFVSMATGGIAPGIYFVRIVAGQQSYARRLIITAR